MHAEIERHRFMERVLEALGLVEFVIDLALQM
jgi:hypothetical protein